MSFSYAGRLNEKPVRDARRLGTPAVAKFQRVLNQQWRIVQALAALLTVALHLAKKPFI